MGDYILCELGSTGGVRVPKGSTEGGVHPETNHTRKAQTPEALKECSVIRAEGI